MAYDIPIGAITICCEAADQPPASRRDIASVLANRLRDGRWGKTLAAVCLKRMQFSEWNADPIDNRNLERVAALPDGDLVLADCADAVKDAIDGSLVDGTGGALYYHDNSIAPPTWTQGMNFLGQRGRFLFYTDK